MSRVTWDFSKTAAHDLCCAAQCWHRSKPALEKSMQSTPSPIPRPRSAFPEPADTPPQSPTPQNNSATNQDIWIKQEKAPLPSGAKRKNIVSLPELLTVTETADYLKVPVQTIYSWIHRKRLPAFKIGCGVRIRADFLAARLQGEQGKVLNDTITSN